MTDAEQRDLVHEWLRYAREDIEGAEEISSGAARMAPRHACFLAQQGAEKALKAILIYLQIEFPRTHNLDLLRDLIPDGWLVRAVFPDLRTLSEWVIEARYISDMPDATDSDARLTTKLARDVYETVLRDLAMHGFPPDVPGAPDDADEGDEAS